MQTTVTQAPAILAKVPPALTTTMSRSPCLTGATRTATALALVDIPAVLKDLEATKLIANRQILTTTVVTRSVRTVPRMELTGKSTLGLRLVHIIPGSAQDMRTMVVSMIFHTKIAAADITASSGSITLARLRRRRLAQRMLGQGR